MYDENIMLQDHQVVSNLINMKINPSKSYI